MSPDHNLDRVRLSTHLFTKKKSDPTAAVPYVRKKLISKGWNFYLVLNEKRTDDRCRAFRCRRRIKARIKNAFEIWKICRSKCRINLGGGQNAAAWHTRLCLQNHLLPPPARRTIIKATVLIKLDKIECQIPSGSLKGRNTEKRAPSVKKNSITWEIKIAKANTHNGRKKTRFFRKKNSHPRG
jgi:hypothetical protein